MQRVGKANEGQGNGKISILANRIPGKVQVHFSSIMAKLYAQNLALPVSTRTASLRGPVQRLAAL